MFSLATDPVLRHQFDVPLVVVTLAAIDAEVQIRRFDEVRKQIIAADRVIVTKSEGRAETVEKATGCALWRLADYHRGPSRVLRWRGHR